MRKIVYFFIALLVCAACIGTVSAWSSNTAATVSPTGSLMPGQSVTATMQVIMPTDGIGSDGYLIMTTPLDSPQWSIDIKYSNGDSPLTSREGTGKTLRLSGFELSYNEEITIAILLNGNVPSSAAGQEISVITVTQDPSKGSVSANSSTKQSVYNPSDVPKQIENVQSGVNDLETQITEASTKGVNVADALAKLEEAKSALKAAQNAGTSDPATANKQIASASGYLVESEKLMVKSTLELVKSNLDEVDTILNQLAAKNWNTDNRVILLTTTKQGAKNLYDTAKAGYDSSSSSVSDLIKTQSLEALTDSSKAVTDGKALLEEANKSPLDSVGNFLPYIIIGVVAIIIIIGVIMVIRRRNDDWDELG